MFSRRTFKTCCLVIFAVLVVMVVLNMLSKEEEEPSKSPDLQQKLNKDVIVQHTNNQQMDRVPANKDRKVEKKPILIYTTLFGAKYWGGLGPGELDTVFDRECKEYKACTVTYDKAAISTAAAVVFYLSDMPFPPKSLQTLKANNPSTQKWVFFSQESPVTYGGYSKYANLFDWLMSYKLSSDVFVPYWHFRPLETYETRPPTNINYAKGKTEFGIWIVSHCGLARDNFMKRLKELIPITVAGRCSKRLFNEEHKCNRGTKECREFVSKYKFYFALENSFCEDYVTEKYWEKGIGFGLIPVVMGATYNKSNVIPGSYIDALQFSSVDKLASYLKYLDANDDEYNKYFAWKQHYIRIVFPWVCEVCKKLHVANITHAPYKEIWSKENDCNPYQYKNDILQQLIKN